MPPKRKDRIARLKREQIERRVTKRRAYRGTIEKDQPLAPITPDRVDEKLDQDAAS